MKRVIGAILFVIYSIIAITVTVLLLSFNEYNCSEIGNYTIYIVKDDSLEPEYKQGSILIIESTNDKHVKVGDDMFLYKVINSNQFEFVNRTLASKAQQGNRIIYVTNEGENYANEYFIGKESDTIVIEGWGTLLSILESKWGYLFCIVIVSLLLFLQEVFELIIELKYGSGKKGKNGTKKTTTTASTGTKKTTTAKKTTTKTATKPAAKTVAKPVVKNEEEVHTGEKEG